MGEELIAKFVAMFDCDTARISRYGGEMFLVIGRNRNTRDDPGQWTRDGEPWHFDYVKETVIASGRTAEELVASAEEYKRLSGITMEEYLAEAVVAGDE